MKRENDKQRRRLDRLATAEQNVRERLLELRGELDGLARGLDRLTLAPPPRMHAGLSGRSHGLTNLLPFTTTRKR